MLEVTVNMEEYERHLYESEIYLNLKEAEIESNNTDKRYSHGEVFDELRKCLMNKVGIN